MRFDLVLFMVAMFTGIILALVLVLMAARSRLVAQGKARIRINDGADLDADTGATLLGSLTAARVFIPSACGGKGSCGVCKVKVVSGGGGPLPTELSHLSRVEQRRGVRLACQVKVREDMEILLPPEVFAARKWECEVVSNRNVSTFIKELVMRLPEGEEVPFRAGGYIQVECPPHEISFADFEIDPEYRVGWKGMHGLRSRAAESVTRAYSMANCPEEKGIVRLNVRIATPPAGVGQDIPPGIMSSWLFGRKTGDRVTISGPFGEFFARDGNGEMVFIGGGAGMAPMRSHILDQLRRLRSGRKISFWYGARSLQEAFYVDEFNALQEEFPNFRWTLALSEPRPEDGWAGPVGFIHQVVQEDFLKHHPNPEELEYYLCGPPAMLKACRDMLGSLGVESRNVLFDDFGV